MKPHILKISKKGMSHEQWLQYRMKGIGGSDVAAVLNLNPFKASVQLFYEKSTQDVENIQNERMFWGTVHEDTIADVWQYYDPKGTVADMMNNYDNGTIIRKCRRINSIIQNEKYPHLLANLDREIVKSPTNKEGILEIKTISDFAVEQWESGIPPYHIVQLQTYLMLYEKEYGELAMLKNGRNFEVIPFEANKEIQEGIAIKTAEFWQRILEAREILASGKGSIEHLEPEPDGSEAYEKFLKARFKAKPVTIKGTEQLYLTAIAERECNIKADGINKIKQLHKNMLVDALRDVEKIDFGMGKGYVSLRPNSNGIRTFLNKVK